MSERNRVVERLDELGRIGRYEHGIDRPLASSQERQARALFASWARASEFSIAQDVVGNLFARRDGSDPTR
ncbi:MAG TPA: hypothetical protein VIJ12_04420, partial [Candidatus Baltobacteraceae bacterium]